jgi:hypothetical protein
MWLSDLLTLYAFTTSHGSNVFMKENVYVKEMDAYVMKMDSLH